MKKQDLDKAIQRLANIDPDLWKVLAMKASWYYRTEGLKPMPSQIRAALGGEVLSREAWDEIRRAVTLKRKSDRYFAAKYARDLREQRRRVNMRAYMRKYRAQKKQAKDTKPCSTS